MKNIFFYHDRMLPIFQYSANAFCAVQNLPKFWEATLCLNPDYFSREVATCATSIQ